MRPLEVCRIASQDTTIRDAMITASKTGRRTGAVLLLDDQGKLAGVFTDSDLARILENRDDAALDQPMSSRMTKDPITTTSGSRLQEATAIMSNRRISELPVVDERKRPIGLLDITDLVALTELDNSPTILPFS